MDTPGLTADELATMLRQIVRAEFPALAASRYQVSRLARVVAVHTGAGATSDLEARISVDVEVLRPDGTADSEWPVVTGVVWPVAWVGPARIAVSVPAINARVRLSWLYGSPAHPAVDPWGAEGFEVPVDPGPDLVVSVGGTEIRVTADGAIRVSAAAGKTVHVLGDDVVLGGTDGKRLLTEDYAGHTHSTWYGASGPGNTIPGLGQTTKVRAT